MHRFEQNPQCKISLKSFQWELGVFYMGGQTGITNSFFTIFQSLQKISTVFI